MKIVHKNIQKDGSGTVEMIPVDSEDLWCIYNLVAPQDTVQAFTVRKVLRESESRGKKDAERVRINLEIVVQDVKYDKLASSMRIKGNNISANEHVNIGAFHTVTLELNQPFVLRKQVWDTVAKEALDQASDPKASADVVAVLIHRGVAQISLVGKRITRTHARIEANLPQNSQMPGPAKAGVEKALTKFYESVTQAFIKHADFSIIRCAVIAGPDSTKDLFYKHLLLEAQRKQLKPIIQNKSRIVLVQTSTGHGLREVLEAPNVMNMIKDTKAAQEVRALKAFFHMQLNDEGRTCYGPVQVEKAIEMMAVENLLITDDLFKSSDVETRKKYINLVDSVKYSGGKSHIFSSMHVSGEQLAQLTGVAAILRFPLPYLDDMDA